MPSKEDNWIIRGRMSYIMGTLSTIGKILSQYRMTYVQAVLFLIVIGVCLYIMWEYGKRTLADVKCNDKFYLRIQNKRKRNWIPESWNFNLAFIICIILGMNFADKIMEFFEKIEGNPTVNILKMEMSTFAVLLALIAIFPKWSDYKNIVIPMNNMLSSLKIFQKTVKLVCIILVQCIIGVFCDKAWYIGVGVYVINLTFTTICLLKLLLSMKNEEVMLYSLHEKLWYVKDGNTLFAWGKNNIEMTMNLFLNEFQIVCSKVALSKIKRISYDSNINLDGTSNKKLKNSSCLIVSIGLMVFGIFFVKGINPIIQCMHSIFPLNGKCSVWGGGMLIIGCFTLVYMLFQWKKEFQICCIMFVYGCCSYEIVYDKKTKYIGKLSFFIGDSYLKLINLCKSIYVYFDMAEGQKADGIACRKIIVDCCGKWEKNDRDIGILICMFEEVMRDDETISIEVSNINDNYKNIADAIINDIACGRGDI